MNYRSERGIAMVMSLFMVLVLSALSTSLMFVSQSETWASHNYRLTSQARYAAESGLHRAAHYLMYSYTPPGSPVDPLLGFLTSLWPVRAVASGQPVMLSSHPGILGTYPVPSVAEDFAKAVQGTIALDETTATYNAVARLLAMQQITDFASGGGSVLQTWQIDAEGRITGARGAVVEVSAIVERVPRPVFQYAAFATADGCGALSFAGGARTDSYDSRSLPLLGLPPDTDRHSAGVGTNGNLTESGNSTVIHGSLSTPRAGVGDCTSGNLTAQTVSGSASVEGGLVQLPQPVVFTPPPAPNPAPPTNAVTFSGACPRGTPNCIGLLGNVLITPTPGPPYLLGDVTVTSGTTLRLAGGTYHLNSLTVTGNSRIEVVPGTGPVIVKIAGQGTDSPLTFTGNADIIANASYDPSLLQFIYGGTGHVQMSGNSNTAALIYAPNASASMSGNSDVYGAVLVRQLTATGGASLHYDRNLQYTGMTAGSYTMSSFTWKTF